VGGCGKKGKEGKEGCLFTVSEKKLRMETVAEQPESKEGGRRVGGHVKKRKEEKEEREGRRCCGAEGS